MDCADATDCRKRVAGNVLSQCDEMLERYRRFCEFRRRRRFHEIHLQEPIGAFFLEQRKVCDYLTSRATELRKHMSKCGRMSLEKLHGLVEAFAPLQVLGR
jgi:hypothetical protein